MWLPVVAAALAAPLAPAVQPGVDVAVRASFDRTSLVDSACASPGDGCDAARVTDVQGIYFTARPFDGGLSIVATLSRMHDASAASGYEGDGAGAGVGLRYDVPVGPGHIAVQAAVEHARSWDGSSTSPSFDALLDDLGGGAPTGLNHARRTAVDVTGAWMWGDPRDGATGWAGLEATPWSRESTSVLDGSFTLDLRRAFPVSLIVGGMLVSEPVGGAGTQPRLTAGAQAALGGTSRLEAWISLSL